MNLQLYLTIKVIHIISSTVLFGTGLGIAFFMWWANKKGDLAAKVYALKTTVIADFMFTLPTVIIQPVSGLILVKMAGYNIWSTWLVLTYIGYVIAGLCWMPVVFLQIKLRNIAIQAFSNNQTILPPAYYKLFKLWFFLGWPAFFSLVIIFFLMVFRPV